MNTLHQVTVDNSKWDSEAYLTVTRRGTITINKTLLSKIKDEAVVKLVHSVAKCNGPVNLTVGEMEQLKKLELEQTYSAFLKREKDIKYLLSLDPADYNDTVMSLVSEVAQEMARINAGNKSIDIDFTKLKICHDCGGSGASRYAMSYSCIHCEGYGYYPNKKTKK
jgi:hypothetical protein